MTWSIEIQVCVIRGGETNGAYLLCYQNSTMATIKVGATPVPEFHINPALEVFTVLTGVILLLKKGKDWKEG